MYFYFNQKFYIKTYMVYLIIFINTRQNTFNIGVGLDDINKI